MTQTTATIATFITAMLDADEAAARASSPGGWQFGGVDSVAGGSLYDETRMIGEVHYEQPGDHDGQIVRHLLAAEADANGQHIARHDPARVLAQVAAHRTIVELHHPYDHGGDHGDYVFCSACQWDHGDESPRVDMDFEQFGKPCPTLRALASIWADDPGFQESWR